MVGHLGVLQPLSLALFLQFHEVGQRAHLFLHGAEANEAVELFVRVALEGVVHDHGVFLLHLFCVLCRIVGGVRLLIVVYESADDTQDNYQCKGAYGHATTAFEDFVFYFFEICHHVVCLVAMK